MPALRLRLGPVDLADLDEEVARARPPARLSRGTLAAQLVRQALAARRGRRAAELATRLRAHPVRRGAGMPVALQEQALAAIAGGATWLIPPFLRAGDWDRRVQALARRWKQDGLTLDELCSAGKVGLLRAVSRYRPGKGFKTFAYMWIRKELERCCRTHGAIVMETEDEMRTRRTVEKHARKGLTPSAIAKVTGLSPAQVERGLQGRRALGWKALNEETN